MVLLFQSLGRDSVLSNPAAARRTAAQAGFNPSVGILFCRTSEERQSDTIFPGVSIPRSGFCFVELQTITRQDANDLGFNPSVGILFCRTGCGRGFGGGRLWFQSLGRDSVLSNCWSTSWLLQGLRVSIPRSGFCFVERTAPIPPDRQLCVSIPRSGFCFVELHRLDGRLHLPHSFNPSVGILFCRTFLLLMRHSVTTSFNPSVGILFCRTSMQT